MPQKVKKKGKERKQPFCDKLVGLFEKYPAVFIVTCSNIGSHHMQKIKKALRDKCIIVKGKNTLIRKTLKNKEKENPKWSAITPYIKGNIALVFADGDLSEIKKLLLDNRVYKLAKIGIIAPQDVTIEKGPTGLEPTKTSFLQTLGIASKINRGQIDILQDVTLIRAGTKVGNSQAVLLQMLNRKPFSYGLSCNYYYEDGKIYSSKLIDVSLAEVMQRFRAGISTIAAISLEIEVPTIASVPHSLINAYKNLLAISIESDYVFDQARAIKEAIENPEAFVQVQEVDEPVKVDEPVDEPEEIPEETKKKDSSDEGVGGFFGMDDSN
jgi:large subunit ribosomal protein LP0